MHRRPFLKFLGASLLAPAACARAASRTAAAGTAAGAAGASAATAANGAPRLGLQLYTLRDAAAKDLPKTLADIAAAGYTDVELLQSMRNFGAPPKLLRETLDRLGLRAPSTHVDIEAFDQMDRLLDDAHVLGHQQLVVPSLDGTYNKTLDGWKRAADRLNEAGARARRAGLWVAFHSEPDHFPRIDGQVPYEVLVERTDPSVVRHQLDMGNAAMGGADPLALLRKYNDRYYSFHVKDAPALGATHDVELGRGIVPVAQIFREAKHVAPELAFVEQETYPGDPLDSVKRDRAFMRSIGR